MSKSTSKYDVAWKVLSETITIVFHSHLSRILYSVLQWHDSEWWLDTTRDSHNSRTVYLRICLSWSESYCDMRRDVLLSMILGRCQFNTLRWKPKAWLKSYFRSWFILIVLKCSGPNVLYSPIIWIRPPIQPFRISNQYFWWNVDSEGRVWQRETCSRMKFTMRRKLEM